MGYEAQVLRVGDVDPSFALAWDAMPPRRGVQADYHDSHAWLASWSEVAGPAVTDRLRVVAALDGGRPVALLPLEARARRRWESAGTRAVGTHRKRWRPVLDAEQPDEEALGLLVDAVARSGVRDLALNRLPTHDPATGALLAALRGGGYAVHARERSSDCLAAAAGGWAEHRRRFAGYDRSVKRLLKRSRPWWEVCLEEYGPRAARPVDEGFELYADLFCRSWKRSLPDRVRRERLELLRRTERLGWCRVYVLRVAGVPAAAELWFRVGDVASGPSTVYDRRMAALGPGSIVVWWALERMFAESPGPRLVDLLPGSNPLKDRLTPERPPLLIVEAARRTLVSGASFPVRRQARSLSQAATGRAFAAVRRRLARRRQARSAAAAAGRARVVDVPPLGRAPSADRLEPDVAVLRFLAVAGGHASPEAMARTWPAGDAWWAVGEAPAALLRLGAGGDGPPTVREVVLVRPDAPPVEELAGAVAAALGAPVRVALAAAAGGPPGPGGRGEPVPVREAVLPWPAGAGRAASAEPAQSP
jgi:Acetyltransferase (GNAT) domain